MKMRDANHSLRWPNLASSLTIFRDRPPPLPPLFPLGRAPQASDTRSRRLGIAGLPLQSS